MASLLLVMTQYTSFNSKVGLSNVQYNKGEFCSQNDGNEVLRVLWPVRTESSQRMVDKCFSTHWKAVYKNEGPWTYRTLGERCMLKDVMSVAAECVQIEDCDAAILVREDLGSLFLVRH